MQHLTKHSWLTWVLLPLVAVLGLAYVLNQPPTRSDTEQVFGPNTLIDRVLSVDSMVLVLSHTSNTDHYALIQRSWGSINMLQRGSVTPETPPNGTARVSYQPLFLGTKTGQLVQGQVLLPAAHTVQIILDDQTLLAAPLSMGRFGVAYVGTQAVCRVAIYDAGTTKLDEYRIEPYAPPGSDHLRYDCAP